MRERDEIDLEGEIDRALLNYCAVEPVEDLGRRVLSRIYAPRSRPYAWLTALPAIAAAVLIGVYLQTDKVLPPAPFQASVPELALAATVDTKTLLRHHHREQSRETLTEEERSLLILAKSFSVQAEQAFTALRTQSESDLEIEPIAVTPLTIEGNQP